MISRRLVLGLVLVTLTRLSSSFVLSPRGHGVDPHRRRAERTLREAGPQPSPEPDLRLVAKKFRCCRAAWGARVGLCSRGYACVRARACVRACVPFHCRARAHTHTYTQRPPPPPTHSDGDGLEGIVVTPKSGQYQAVVVWLHGLGDSDNEWYKVMPAFGLPRLAPNTLTRTHPRTHARARARAHTHTHTLAHILTHMHSMTKFILPKASCRALTMNVHTHIHAHTRTYTHARTRTHTKTHARIRTHARTRTQGPNSSCRRRPAGL